MLETIHTRQGPFVVDDGSDKKMAVTLRHGTHQEEALEVLKDFVTRRSVVVDIGAHIGTLAIPLARVAGRVIAFEPVRASANLLRKNAVLNKVAVEVREMGLAERAGTANLRVVNPENAGANMLRIGEGGLKISTLDAEVERADVVKIDVEGMELSVLRGGLRLIGKDRPVILFEINLTQLRLNHARLEELQRFFDERDYSLYIPLGKSLGRVRSLVLLTSFITPRSLVFGGASAPFDVLAVPRSRPLPLPARSSSMTLVLLAGRYLKRKRVQWI